MLRRLLIIVLTLSVPVQGIAMPHAHRNIGDGELDPHPQTPHFHLGHSHHHDHQHPGKHRHSHHEATTSEHAHEGADKQPEQFGARVGSGSHDESAIYVAGDLGLNLTKMVRQVSSGVNFVIGTLSGPRNELVSIPLRALAGQTPLFLGVPLFLSALSLRL